MQPRETLAVIDDEHFYSIRGISKHDPIKTLDQLLWMCQKAGYTHIWVKVGCGLEDTIFSDETAAWNTLATYKDREKKEQMNYLRAWRTDGEGATIHLAWTKFLTWHRLGCESPRTLLSTIANLEDILGAPIEWTPGHVSLELLRIKNAARWDWWKPVKWELDTEMSRQQIDSIMMEFNAWKSTELPPGKYCHKIDKNSGWPAAATGLRIGAGEPLKVMGGKFDESKPGFWSVEVFCGHPDRLKHPIWNGQQLPDLTLIHTTTTDMINELRKQGFHVIVKSGWQWQEYHQSLRNIFEWLWGLRKEWRKKRKKAEAYENVYQGIGLIMHALPGKLGDKDNRQKHFRRRDILAMIMAKSTANIIHQIEYIRQQTGLKPIMSDKDAFYFVCDEPDIMKVFPAGVIDIEKLGAYKHQGTIEVTSEFHILFDQEKRPGKLFRLFKELLAQRAEQEKPAEQTSTTQPSLFIVRTQE